MRLVKFRVQKFKSIQDSGWIDINDWACFVGLNETGKTNLLKALYRLNPIKNSDIQSFEADYPSSEYDNSPELKSNFFIHALFKIDNDDKKKLATMTGSMAGSITFKKLFPEDCILLSRNYNNEIYALSSDLEIVETSEIPLNRMQNEIYELFPKFIYYSEYEEVPSHINLRNLTSQSGFYNAHRDQHEGKIRDGILKKLLEYLGLEDSTVIEKILQTDADSILTRDRTMTSKSVQLTKSFKSWWPNQDCNLEFRTDGDYLKILFTDENSGGDNGIKYKSAGLKWALSFFLTFLADSKLENFVLLLDDPGLKLHPTIQKELVKLFKDKSKENQILYTTHLPFLIDGNNLENLYEVYRDNESFTKVSNDLQMGSKRNSIQPVYAAIGMSAAESLFMDGNLVVVEGESEQFYLRMIQQYLDSIDDFEIENLFFFIPAGGASNIKHIVSIIIGSEEGSRPYVLYDSDSLAKDCKKSLKEKLYSNDQEKILEINDILNKKNAEIEDIIPSDWIIVAFKDYVKAHYKIDISKDEITIGEDSITTELENFTSEKHEISLKANESWKTEIAKIVKRNFVSSKVDENHKKMWMKLFDALQGKKPKTEKYDKS